REEDVDSEGPVRRVLHPPDLLAEELGRPVRGGDDAEPTRLGHGGGERGARDPSHPRLADGVADAEEIAERRVQDALRVRGQGRALLAPGVAGAGVAGSEAAGAATVTIARARGPRQAGYPRGISRVTGRVCLPKVGCQLECFPAPPTTMM